MTNPDEEITMRQAEVEALHARLAEGYALEKQLRARSNALAYLWQEARQQAEEWRNEAVCGDKDQCCSHDEPLPWEGVSAYQSDIDSVRQEFTIDTSSGKIVEDEL